jgi:GNAT superfamily N-acetyltransferase
MSAADSLGIQFSHRGDAPVPSPSKHYIEATGPDGQWVGHLSMMRSPNRQNVFLTGNIDVDIDHQRQGVGTALWNEAEQAFPEHKFVHMNMSPGGQRLAERMQSRNPDRHVLIHDKFLSVKEIEDRL